MITMEFRGIDKIAKELKDLSDRRIRSAAATALTRTAVALQKRTKEEMKRVFQGGPTPYTERAVRYIPATAKRLGAAVGFNIVAFQDERGNVLEYRDEGEGQTPQGKYIQFQMNGGQRRQKRFEKALQYVGVLPAGWFCVPGEKAKLDRHGNHVPSEIRQILSWFDAGEMTAGSTQNMRDKGREKRRKGTRKKAGFEYFAVQPGGVRTFKRANGKTGTHKMQPGVYRRTFHALGTSIEPIIIFVRGAAYRARFDFYAMMKREAGPMLEAETARAISQALARAGGQ